MTDHSTERRCDQCTSFIRDKQLRKCGLAPVDATRSSLDGMTHGVCAARVCAVEHDDTCDLFEHDR